MAAQVAADSAGSGAGADPLSRAGLIAVFPKVFAGEHVDHPAVEFVRARRVSIEADDIVAYADGERLGALPIEVDVVPAALSVHT